MENITITERNADSGNVTYLSNTLSELFCQLHCEVACCENTDRAIMNIRCSEEYADIVRAETADRIAEVIAVQYKYRFFSTSLKISGLSEIEREILLASLIAADLEEDKKYANKRLFGLKNIAIDGAYNFLMRPLLYKWRDIIEYIPSVFIGAQLKDFITYMLEGRKKRVYVDDGKVYDVHYRLLRRCALLGGQGARITREVLLSGGGEVELFGSLESDDEYYLKEYFGDKIYFSARKFC